MDELLVDYWERPGLRTQRRPTGFVPRVDVYYVGEKEIERAVVRAELPGVDVSAVQLEARGRRLVIAGEKPLRETQGRTYQQVELPSGPFRRVIELSIEVDPERAEATYSDGVLEIDLPARSDSGARTVPIQRAGREKA